MNWSSVVDVVTRWRAYIAGVGLLGLGVYQLSQGDLASSFQSIMTGLAAFHVGNNDVAFTQLKAAHDSLLLQLKSKELRLNLKEENKDAL